MKNTITKIAFALVATVGAVAAQAADMTHYSGTFGGLNDHAVSGSVRIVTHDNGEMHVVLGKDFRLDGAPDPKVSVGNASGHGTVLGPLKKLTGEQHFKIPSNVTVNSDTVVWIWCEQFSVPLGRTK